ncbi:MAG: hypothetical protein EZS28_032623 [Streblomastix strix]|uniref:Uncharacterized protein n=1 Tax=Streblomastix strix TaxID=222440 RepID=A0A5J4UMZ5_9EUKA|nr:MAG: hypothetical protein EZS28_032623 [Streblomastix strix]
METEITIEKEIQSIIPGQFFNNQPTITLTQSSIESALIPQVIKSKRKYERKEDAKCGRSKNYETEEQAKTKARKQRNQFQK